MTKIRYDWKMIEVMCEDIANQVRDSHYDYIYGLPRGGLIPAVMISHLLNIPMIRNLPSADQLPFHFNRILVIDDIVDSGGTISDFICGVRIFDHDSPIDVASLFWRKDVASFKPNYYAATVDNKDVWIFFPWETNRDTVSNVVCTV